MRSQKQISQKIKQAQEVLREMGLPHAQQNEISALTLLALTGVKPGDDWNGAYRNSLTITKGVMNFIAHKYKRPYAPNTRETVRRQVLHQFMQAHLVDYNPDNPTLPTNSPRAHYALANAAVKTIRAYGTKQWPAVLRRFVKQHGKLVERYQKSRKKNLVPVTLSNGKKLELSPGKHNEVQAAVIHEFAPRFVPGAKVLYLGDTAKKNLILDAESLEKFNIPIKEHDKLPDIILLDDKKNRLFLVEVVTSHGPVTPKRVVELEKMLKNCKLKRVYMSAFPDFAQFKRQTSEIAWETEVWLADIPDHMIHYNGDKFIV